MRIDLRKLRLRFLKRAAFQTSPYRRIFVTSGLVNLSSAFLSNIDLRLAAKNNALKDVL